MSDERLFDLNIEKILEAWDTSHAVRELIANALDEQILTDTKDVSIDKADGTWTIRDYGRGLRYEHFTQNESVEKLQNAGKVIGKFGVGLKDSLATLYRNGIHVELESAHCLITLVQQPKHDFTDVVTLHAAIAAPRDLNFIGTAVRLSVLRDEDMAAAKGFFLRFSGDEVLEATRFGRILRKNRGRGRIYVAGLLVAEEENFAFSYDITSLTEAMKRALNRERTNVGRTAYSDRVKQMLLQTKSPAVAGVLADQLIELERGTSADEVKWKEVAVHACRILSASGKYLFVTPEQLAQNPNAIDHARSDGIQIVTVNESIHSDVAGSTDIAGAPVRDIGVYQDEWNESFKFDFVDPRDLTASERAVFDCIPQIVTLAGGLPANVKGLKISRTMRVDFATGTDALGVWDSVSQCIVLRRDQLSSVSALAGTLLHELTHARTGFGDVTREFETALTDLLGSITAAALTEKQTDPPRRTGLLSWLF